MSVRNKRFSIVVLALLVFSAAIILTCSDKILNSNPEQGIEFEIALKYADGEQLSVSEIVNAYRVIIITDEDTITASLEFADGLITGLIENVPAGPNRTIIVEGLASDGTVLYRGSVVIDVIANQTVDAIVTLLPVAKLVRISPNYSGKFHGEEFTSDIKVNNIHGLTSIELALDYNSNVVQLDSLKAGSNIPDGSNFTYSDEGGIEISLSHSSSLTDSAGNVTVARAFFSPTSSNKCLDSTLLDLGVQSLTAPGLSLGEVYVDDGKAVITSGRIKVTPDTLRFGIGVEGLNLDFKQVSITDSCGNALPFTLFTEENWIDLNTAAAGITPATAFIDVDPTGLGTGAYQGTILVNSPRSTNAPYQIVVTLEIDRGARFLELIPDSLYFTAVENGPLPAVQEVTVQEQNGFNIEYHVLIDAPWLTNMNGGGLFTPNTIGVQVSTTNLEPGTYVDEVVVSSEEADNSPRIVKVVYVVTSAAKFLEVIPDTLYFGAVENGEHPSSQDFRVFETGGYNIGFNATESAPWLDLSGISGTTPDTITANIASTELDPGTYNATITVSSEFAENSPQTVTVIYTVEKGPRVIAAEPASIHFALEQGGALPDAKTFQVFETGGYSIDYSAFENASWFSISGVSGTTTDTVTVSIDNSDLAPGMYRDSIEITSEEADNSPIYVVVTLGVMVGPKTIAVGPDSLHFECVKNSENCPTRQFRVFEANGYSIPFEVLEEITWLSLSSESGITEDTITVHIIPEFEPGLYVDSIAVVSEVAQNVVAFVKVSLQVYPGPMYLVVEPDSFHFSYEIGDMEAMPWRETLLVRELDDLELSFTISEDINWLQIQDVDGFTPDSISMHAGTYLVPGYYHDSVMISSSDALNSPVYVNVTFEVTEQQNELLVVPDSLFFEYIQYSDAIPTGYFEVFEWDGYQFSFEAIENSEWISLHNISGTTPDRIDVSVDISLEPGIYVDSIMITSNEAVNSPQYVKIVSQIIYAPYPAFELNPDTLYFEAIENGNLPDSDSFTVNINSYPVNFLASESIPWLDISNDSGTVSGTVGVHITSTELEPNVYFDSIRVSLSGERDYDPTYEYIVYTVSPFIDSIPPSAVTDLKVDDYTNTSALLSWTASGNDGAQGTAAETDIRFSTSLETLFAWDNATQVDGEPVPQTAGSAESFNVTGLTPDNTYYFALDIIDDAGNHSGLSNVDSVYLPPFAPDAPVLIAPEDNSTGAAPDVTFIWHSSERANVYELEYDTDSNFSEPYSFNDLSDTVQSVEPLNYETTYYWRVRASNN
ncbi:MAG TPA: cohesin domain-containing protein, partial [candidate division Zixibacteria bacterium]|nr:cohesin domain-containing protein [candidate division Zixibacteria bacterium]